VNGRLVASAVIAAVACAGCTSKAPGEALPVAGDSSTVPPTSTSQSGGAPPIKSPELDLGSYEQRVCDLLTLAQLAPFEIRVPGKAHEESGIGQVCAWRSPDVTTGVYVDLTILSKVGYGWEGVHQRRARWAKFESAGEINGYPAVHLLATKIDEETGSCLTAAGVNQKVVFEVDVNVNDIHSAEYKNPCPVADRIAGLVIDTLKRGR
jgi:Protein of unknown function (DUF3558)